MQDYPAFPRETHSDTSPRLSVACVVLAERDVSTVTERGQRPKHLNAACCPLLRVSVSVASSGVCMYDLDLAAVEMLRGPTTQPIRLSCILGVTNQWQFI